ncbi:hypothetical protein B0H34DRAFT_276516 [Crassisporium funariophilum]|nr:hypothetical protein B0H34DRAFT_276516 [Crassisporium funariophilum]
MAFLRVYTLSEATAVMKNQSLLTPRVLSGHLDALVKSTNLAFSRVLPWCQNISQSPTSVRVKPEKANSRRTDRTTSDILDKLSHIASQYIKAVGNGISASQSLFNLAEDALKFSGILNEYEDNDIRKHPITEKDRGVFLADILAAATKGQQLADKSRELFRQIIDETEAAAHGVKGEEHEMITAVLEFLASHVALYAHWWNMLELGHRVQQLYVEVQNRDYSSLRNAITVQQWEDFRNMTMQYNEKMSALRDVHMDLFRYTADKRSPSATWRNVVKRVMRGLVTDNSVASVANAKYLINTPTVVLGPPKKIDLKALAESTEQVFRLLEPWCHPERQSLPAFKFISHQAKGYIQAIDFSIVASKQGFTIAQDAVAFSANLVVHEDFMDKAIEDDRQKYLLGMAKLAEQGLTVAQVASQRFRDVRTTVLRLIREAKGMTDDKDRRADELLSELEGKINIIEQFATHLSDCCQWWNATTMLHTYLVDKSRGVVFNYSAIKNKMIVDTWMDIMGTYSGYIQKMRNIQDNYPAYFVESSRKQQSDWILGW